MGMEDLFDDSDLISHVVPNSRTRQEQASGNNNKVVAMEFQNAWPFSYKAWPFSYKISGVTKVAAVILVFQLGHYVVFRYVS